MTTSGRGEAPAVDKQTMIAVSAQLQALDGLTLAQLQKKHLELYGSESRTKNKSFLRKKLAYRIQERAEGGRWNPSVDSAWAIISSVSAGWL